MTRSKLSKFAAMALAIPGLALATPASAAAQVHAPAQPELHGMGDLAWQHGRDRGRHEGWDRGRGNRDRYYRGDRYRDDRYRGDRYRGTYYGDPVYRDTRIWRGRDGSYYCRKQDGTTGLLVGAAVGGLIGNEVSSRGDKTAGTIIGAIGGAILGRSIDRSNARCR
ncbi:MAG: glycine zipper 2TM domain-containing protein [Sphingomonadaceae bacterium]|nr:glycine zipper 2TM domain-containing protein [Sphingomonadaceae bacterium]